MYNNDVVSLLNYSRVRSGRGLFTLAACAALAACAGTSVSRAADGLGSLPEMSKQISNHSRAESNLIRQDEMRGKSVQTAYEAVQRLRPHFLAAGHVDTLLRAVAPPAAVVEKGLPESIDALKSIPADAVLDIRFVEPQDAVTLFGARYSGGVVIVRLTSQRIGE